MDHTTRLWDLATQKCKTTFRGHVDSVNALAWQPCTSNLCTGSGDKTVSMWDARSGLCVQTFYGHLNAVNHVALTRKGDVVASCDADGVIKLWDVRSVSELATIETGYYPVNQVSRHSANP
jgi:WD40 repeat protein